MPSSAVPARTPSWCPTGQRGQRHPECLRDLEFPGFSKGGRCVSEQDDADDNENHTSAVLGAFGGCAGLLGMVAAESSRVRRAGEVQTTFGFQIFRKPIRQAIDISEAP